MKKTVLSVSPPKRHLNQVTFSDGTVLELDSDYLLTASIFEGEQMDDIEIENHRAASDFIRARSRALWYLSRSDHSEKALLDKLKRAGFKKETAQRAVCRLKESGLINDEALALRLAENYLRENRSKRECEQKLILKGIPRDLAKAALEKYETDEKAQIEALIEKKYKNKVGDEENLRRTVAALMRKGFKFSDIKAALKKYSNALYECEEM
ncbi:MAG: regulatory protein RecX [Ruminococcaceae bacterium]|nr:regulatory protein RecX [Oscillospiraceae bacterium]